MPIDPILGIDLTDLTPDIRTIPLNSSPLIPDAWEPQGRPGPASYPDNIPTFFANMIAYNNAVPRTVDALSTDGDKNLNVRVINPGSGGSTLLLPMPMFTVSDNLYRSNDYGPTDPDLLFDAVPGDYALFSISAVMVIDTGVGYPSDDVQMWTPFIYQGAVGVNYFLRSGILYWPFGTAPNSVPVSEIVWEPQAPFTVDTPFWTDWKVGIDYTNIGGFPFKGRVDCLFGKVK